MTSRPNSSINSGASPGIACTVRLSTPAAAKVAHPFTHRAGVAGEGERGNQLRLHEALLARLQVDHVALVRFEVAPIARRPAFARAYASRYIIVRRGNVLVAHAEAGPPRAASHMAWTATTATGPTRCMTRASLSASPGRSMQPVVRNVVYGRPPAPSKPRPAARAAVATFSRSARCPPAAANGDPAVADLADCGERLRRVGGDVDRNRVVEVDHADLAVAAEKTDPALALALLVQHVLAGEQTAHLADVLHHAGAPAAAGMPMVLRPVKPVPTTEDDATRRQRVDRRDGAGGHRRDAVAGNGDQRAEACIVRVCSAASAMVA